MSHPPIVMVAKYVPDIHRMEPLNIGIVVWDNGDVEHRFLGDRASGIVIPRAVPEDCRHAYSEWVTFWKIQLSRPSLRGTDGRPVLRESPDFLEILSDKSKPQFMLVECAKLFDPLNGNIAAAADEFYSRLVRPIRQRTSLVRAATSLQKQCAQLFADADISANKSYYHRSHSLTARKGETQLLLEFDYALGDNHIDAVLQRVLLDHPKDVAATSQFEWVQDADDLRLRRDQCAILYNSKLHRRKEATIVGALSVLDRRGVLIDLANRAPAVEKIRSLASSLSQGL